mmetsp:Transcript_21217/g.40239  ORF Transcript_21217/g.40239 Transcript_21217/m.40239 type:complete len:201 (+) Transcript_21217:638-1240(+)
MEFSTATTPAIITATKKSSSFRGRSRCGWRRTRCGARTKIFATHSAHSIITVSHEIAEWQIQSQIHDTTPFAYGKSAHPVPRGRSPKGVARRTKFGIWMVHCGSHKSFGKVINQTQTRTWLRRNMYRTAPKEITIVLYWNAGIQTQSGSGCSLACENTDASHTARCFVWSRHGCCNNFSTQCKSLEKTGRASSSIDSLTV